MLKQTGANNHVLDQLARECGEQAWRLSVWLMRHRADAEDVVQQAYMVAARKVQLISLYNPATSPSSGLIPVPKR